MLGEESFEVDVLHGHILRTHCGEDKSEGTSLECGSKRLLKINAFPLAVSTTNKSGLETLYAPILSRFQRKYPFPF